MGEVNWSYINDRRYNIMELYEKNGNILYILNVLKKYSDEEHILKTTEI